MDFSSGACAGWSHERAGHLDLPQNLANPRLDRFQTWALLIGVRLPALGKQARNVAKTDRDRHLPLRVENPDHTFHLSLSYAVVTHSERLAQRHCPAFNRTIQMRWKVFRQGFGFLAWRSAIS
jgi:hypothetical protein